MLHKQEGDWRWFKQGWGRVEKKIWLQELPQTKCVGRAT